MLLALAGMGMIAQSLFARSGAETQINDLHPFTHLASLPANSDPATIKFERVKAVKVFTKVKSTTDPGYCRELQFRDPGGSMYCPSTQDESPAPAYEVTYSFSGQPLASDEYGNRYFTFRVYFHPEELAPALRRALSAGKISRAELATYFNVTFLRLPARRVVIDEADSSFCDGNFVDGTWTHTERTCQDNISLKTVTTPSDYITIQVDPASPRSRQTAAVSQADHSLEASVRQ